MEYANGGDLMHRIQQEQKFKEPVAVYIENFLLIKVLIKLNHYYFKLKIDSMQLRS